MRTLLFALSAWLLGLTFVSAQTASDFDEGLKVEENTSISGAFTVSWWGRDGWTYFIQQSEDLIQWEYLPVIESGIGDVISYGYSSNASRQFFKLRLTGAPTDDPHAADFDGDGWGSMDEIQMGWDPFDPSDSPPVAVALDLLAQEDHSIAVPLAAVWLPEGGIPATIFEIVTPPTLGQLIQQNGVYRYYPHAHLSGEEVFTYRAVRDGVVGPEATVTIALTAVNDPPLVYAGPNASAIKGVAFVMQGEITDVDTTLADVSIQWSVERAPVGATASFDDDASLTSTVTFSHSGEYLLRLSAVDGESRSDLVLFQVHDSSAPATMQISWMTPAQVSASVAAGSAVYFEVAIDPGTQTIEKVELLRGTALLAEMISVAGQSGIYGHQLPALPFGTYDFTVRVVDGEGRTQSSTVRRLSGFISGYVNSQNPGNQNGTTSGGNGGYETGTGNAGGNGNPNPYQPPGPSNPSPGASSTDEDDDGLSSAEESLLGTDPTNTDSDSDGVPDGQDGWPLDNGVKFPRLPEHPSYAVVELPDNFSTREYGGNDNVKLVRGISDHGEMLVSQDTYSSETGATSTQYGIWHLGEWSDLPATSSDGSYSWISINRHGDVMGTHTNEEGSGFAVFENGAVNHFPLHQPVPQANHTPRTSAVHDYVFTNSGTVFTRNSADSMEEAGPENFASFRYIGYERQTSGGATPFPDFHYFEDSDGYSVANILEPESLSAANAHDVVLFEGVRRYGFAAPGHTLEYHPAVIIDNSGRTFLNEAVNDAYSEYPPGYEGQYRAITDSATDPIIAGCAVPELLLFGKRPDWKRIYKGSSSGSKLHARPRCINIHGQIVGENFTSSSQPNVRGQLIHNGRVVDLSKHIGLVDGEPSHRILYAHEIRDNGLILATGVPKGLSGAENRRVLLLIPIDLAVDSDNNDGLNPPKQDGAEGAKEDYQASQKPANENPGKYIKLSSGDFDNDDTPDFADGMDIHGGSGDDKCGKFVPMIADLSGIKSLTGVKVKFEYNEANPTGITKETVPNDLPKWSPGSGDLRLWRKNGNEARKIADIKSNGDFVKADTEYSITELDADTQGVLTLYVEAVRKSSAAADKAVTMFIKISSQNQWIEADRIRFTAVPRVLFGSPYAELTPLPGSKIKPAFEDDTEAEGQELGGTVGGSNGDTLTVGHYGPHPDAESDETKDRQRLAICLQTGTDAFTKAEDGIVLLVADGATRGESLAVAAAASTPPPSNDPPEVSGPEDWEAQFERILFDKYEDANPRVEDLERDAFELWGWLYGGRSWEFFSGRDVWRDGSKIFIEDSLTPEQAADAYYAYLKRALPTQPQGVNLTPILRYFGELYEQADEDRAKVGQHMAKHWELVEITTGMLESEYLFVAPSFALGGVLQIRRVNNMTFYTEGKVFAVPLIRRNWARGNITEHDTLVNSLGFTRNSGKNAVKVIGNVDGQAVDCIPDSIRPQWYIEVKDWKSLSATRQIRAEFSAAQNANRSVCIIITGRTRKLSQPLMQLIQQEGGLLLRRNVNTDGYEFWNFQTSAWEAADKATVISWLQ